MFKMKKTIFALAAFLIAGLFSSCEKDSETPETPETPEAETYRTHLAGDWYVTDWFGYRNITDGDITTGEFYSTQYTEDDNFIISFDEDGTMTQNLTTGDIVRFSLDFDDLDSEVQFGEDVSIFGNFITSSGENNSGLLSFETEETLSIYMDLKTMTASFECKRKL